MLYFSQAEQHSQPQLEPWLASWSCRRPNPVMPVSMQAQATRMLTHALLCRLSHSPSHSWNLS